MMSSERCIKECPQYEELDIFYVETVIPEEERFCERRCKIEKRILVRDEKQM